MSTAVGFDAAAFVETNVPHPIDIVAARRLFDEGATAIHRCFEAGASTAALLAFQSDLTDAIVKRLWLAAGEGFDQLSLIAVGGYGRAELYPASDIDLCVLLPDTIDASLEERLSRWIATLWDLRREIGHSVRTLEDCRREAAADITVVTNLMESRWLAGDPALFDGMRAVIDVSSMWPSEAYFAGKMDEQAERRRKFQTNAYRLEPNVKESEGGLRDVQMIAWVCQREFGTDSIDDLVRHDLITEREHATLRDGRELIGRLRYLLHRLAGRREDRLLFDYQHDIATALGYTDPEQNQAIERLMQRYYRNVTALQRLNEIILQGIGGVISGVTEASTPVPINKRFQLRNGFLEVTHRLVFVHYPPALLEVFEVFGNTPEATNVRANTVRLIGSHLPLINERFRSDPMVRSLFMRIIRNPNKLTRKFRMMNRYGVLAAYLPAFDAIVGRMQYDLFHLYTVDEHTFRVIRNVRRLMLPEFADETPEIDDLPARIERPEVLYLAALFHDIAKGRGGDHSELGARDAEAFCRRHGVAGGDSALIVWLVRHHLAMSITAQRKDIADPDVQAEFARFVGDQRRLAHLYLFTIADIRATNHDLWNSFRASLLNQLYRATASVLAAGLAELPDRRAVVSRRRAAAMACLGSREDTAERADDGHAARSEPDDAPPMSSSSRRLDTAEVESLFDSLGNDYFLQFEPAEIAQHVRVILLHPDGAGPLVSMYRSPLRGAMELLVYTRDDVALFSLITTVLGQLGLTVLSAVVQTTEHGYALDAFHVLEVDGSLVESERRIAEIVATLRRELATPQDIPALGERRAPRQLRHFSIPTEVRLHTIPESGFTEVHVTAADRPGVLSHIARGFLSAGVSVHAARIATLGERIDDVFLIRSPDGRPIDDETARRRVSDILEERL